MFQKLLALEWKAFFRSASAGRSIAVKIFLGFIAFYFIMVFLTLGFSLYELVEESFPNETPIHKVNDFLLAWFVFELIIRFMLQNLPVMHLKPLLLQKVSRSQMSHYLLTKSIFSFYNLMALLVTIPFAAICFFKGDVTSMQLMAWLLSIFSLVLTINFANYFIKKKFAENLKAFIPLIIVITALALLDYFGVFSVSKLFGQLFTTLLEQPILAMIPLLILIGSYISTFRSLRHNIYLDSYVKNQSDSFRETDLSWTNRFGKLAPFIQLDIRLLQRNKRSRATVIMALLLVFYGLFFYPNPYYQNSTWMVFVGIFITGIFMINFGQFIPAWDSSYYAMLMTQDVSMKLYLNSKVMLMYASAIILTVLSTPYVYFGWDILLINLACALFNMGINVPILLYFGAMNKKRINLDKSQFLNYEGMGAAQWIVGIPLFAIPILLWFSLSETVDKNTATLSLAFLGIIGLVLKNIIINGLAKLYKKRKYETISGFSQQQD
ncbi:DUF5687 family protein [Albibacterium profundi]|uniref:DUF5687 family protein n=1 Tax=Albibacterium profundi TaxID=3134906 RepID=A0ABV5CGF8_9SPHI